MAHIHVRSMYDQTLGDELLASIMDEYSEWRIRWEKAEYADDRKSSITAAQAACNAINDGLSKLSVKWCGQSDVPPLLAAMRFKTFARFGLAYGIMEASLSLSSWAVDGGPTHRLREFSGQVADFGTDLQQTAMDCKYKDITRELHRHLKLLNKGITHLDPSNVGAQEESQFRQITGPLYDRMSRRMLRLIAKWGAQSGASPSLTDARFKLIFIMGCSLGDGYFAVAGENPAWAAPFL